MTTAAHPVTVRRRYHDGCPSAWEGVIAPGRCSLAVCIDDMVKHHGSHAACDLLVGMSDGTTVTIKSRGRK